MRFEKTVEIDLPLAECYRQCINFERYAEWVPAIRSIRHRGRPEVLNWEVETPKGKILTWQMQIDGLRHHNHVISWHTVREGDVVHSGALTLEPKGASQTQLHVVVEAEVDERIRTEDVEELNSTLDQAFDSLFRGIESAQAASRP